MPFCSHCGSFLQLTPEGYWCSKCRKLTALKKELKSEKTQKQVEDTIYIVDSSQEQHAVIPQQCPRCRNKEAYHWLSSSTGEHAGVNQERTLQHFRCTKCGFEWNKT